jgi:hypothetical protein
MMLVDPACQRRGIGRLLLDRLTADAGVRALRLHATAAGIALYRAAGFATTGHIQQHQGVPRSLPVQDRGLRAAGVGDLTAIAEADAADRGDGDTGHVERQLADELAHGKARLAVRVHRHIGAGAADIERQHVCDASLPRQEPGAHDARGGPRHQHAHTVAPAVGRPHDAAVRLGDEGGRRHSALGERRLEGIEVAGDAGVHVGVDDGGRGSLVLAYDRPHGRGREGEQARRHVGGDGERGFLVDRVAVGVEEGDNQALAAPCPRRFDRLADVTFVERCLDGPVSAHALADAEDEFARYQRVRPRAEQAVNVRHRQPSQLEEVLEATGRDQRQACSASLDDGVDADRRAVHDRADRRHLQVVAGREQIEAGADLLARPLRRGQHLEREQRSGRLLEGAEVCERAADVDADAPRHQGLPSLGCRSCAGCRAACWQGRVRCRRAAVQDDPRPGQ